LLRAGGRRLAGASTQHNKRTALVVSGAFTGVGLYSGVTRTEGDGIFDQLRGSWDGMFTKFTAPSREKFLPAMPPHMAHLPTLVLDLDETLIHSVWDRKHGWRTKKRPYVDKFLGEMAKYYEIVIFSAGLQYVVDPVIGALDPNNQMVMWRLYRDCTTYKEGKHIKDLSRLNRDLNKVVMIDDDAEYTEDNPENALIVTRWEGDRDDHDLLDLIPFLRGLAKNGVKDFREEIEKYRKGGTTADLVERYNAELVEELKKEQKKVDKIKSMGGGLWSSGQTGKKAVVLEEQRKMQEQLKMNQGSNPF